MSSKQAGQAAVVINGLNKSYRTGANTVSVLNNLDMQIERGEFVAIMGASGSGKSTLLHLLAGLTTPDGGTITIGGQNLSGMRDHELARFRRRKVGLVFQSFNLIPSLSAADNILLPRLMDHAASNSPLDKDMIALLGLEARLSHHPDALSGGEQQRVAIARALSCDPEILLADEPTGNLDSIATRALGALLRKINEQRGITIMMVTHDALVAAWASRIFFLKDGRIAEELQTKGENDAAAIGARYLAIMEKSKGAVA